MKQFAANRSTYLILAFMVVSQIACAPRPNGRALLEKCFHQYSTATSYEDEGSARSEFMGSTESARFSSTIRRGKDMALKAFPGNAKPETLTWDFVKQGSDPRIESPLSLAISLHSTKDAKAAEITPWLVLGILTFDKWQGAWTEEPTVESLRVGNEDCYAISVHTKVGSGVLTLTKSLCLINYAFTTSLITTEAKYEKVALTLSDGSKLSYNRR